LVVSPHHETQSLKLFEQQPITGEELGLEVGAVVVIGGKVGLELGNDVGLEVGGEDNLIGALVGE